jgi:hypothetical protein
MDSSLGGQMPAEFEGQSKRRVGTRYQARIELDAPPSTLLLGATGNARINVEPASLGRRLYETLRQNLSIGR